MPTSKALSHPYPHPGDHRSASFPGAPGMLALAAGQPHAQAAFTSLRWSAFLVSVVLIACHAEPNGAVSSPAGLAKAANAPAPRGNEGSPRRAPPTSSSLVESPPIHRVELLSVASPVEPLLSDLMRTELLAELRLVGADLSAISPHAGGSVLSADGKAIWDIAPIGRASGPVAILTSRRDTGGDEVLERRLLLWTGSVWRRTTSALPRVSKVLGGVLPDGSLLAVGCAHGCRFEVLVGQSRKPRLTPSKACGTRIDAAVALHVAPDGTLRLLGLECETRHLLVETWLPAETSGKVAELPTHPLPEDDAWDLTATTLSIDTTGKPWVTGLEWFWGGGAPVVDSYVAHFDGASWGRETTPCPSDIAVTRFADFAGKHWVVCGDTLYMRSREDGADYVRAYDEAVAPGARLFVQDDRLFLRRGDDEFWEIRERGQQPGQ